MRPLKEFGSFGAVALTEPVDKGVQVTIGSVFFLPLRARKSGVHAPFQPAPGRLSYSVALRAPSSRSRNNIG